MTATVGVYVYADRFSHSDCIAYLHQYLVGHSSCNHILGYMACSVCCRAIHLRRVFPAEGAASVCSLPAIGIHNNLAARKTRISVGSANDELSGRINMVGDAVVEEFLNPLVPNLLLHPRDKDVNDVLPDALLHTFVGVKLIVLSGQHNSVNALRPVLIVIFNGHLALGIRTQIGHLTSLAPNISQGTQQVVCKVKAQGNVVLRLVGGIAEHHTLISCSLLFRILTVHTAVDVIALLMYGAQHTA